MGLLYGVYGGRSDGFQPGWLGFRNQTYETDFSHSLSLGGATSSYETGFCPHGGKLSIQKS